MKSNNFPSSMKFGEYVASNDSDISNQFARFFQGNYTTNNVVRDYDYFSFLPECANSVTIDNITANELLIALEGLDSSKGPGPDGIPPMLLKKLASAFVHPLSLLFNLSLKLAIFPSVWKKSFLLPIFKSGNRSDINNYRGIAILSCIPKLFESIVNTKMFNQLKHYISPNQHGFYKGRSTATNLLEFVSYSLAVMDRGNVVETLYTDFSKAFDRVDIPMLIFKLQRMGVTGTLLKWVESYLTNRTQFVRFRGKISSPVNVTSGVPQGSHLGPLLFILFVNDVSLVLTNLNILIYADDMKLYMEVTKCSDLVIFQQEVDVFFEWCVKSLLDINVKKCNIISYTRKHETYDFICSLGFETVERCVKIRDLGIILDSKLTFGEHYNTMINKANSMLGFIKRFSYNFSDPYTIKTLYISFVRSILEYCSVVWAPYQELHSNRIESVQKQFLLFALRKLGWTTSPLPPYEARCMLINIETLEKRRENAAISCLIDLVSHRISSENLLENLNFYAPTRALRARNLFKPTSFRTLYAMNGPLNRMMRTYNKYSNVIDVTMTKKLLKKSLTERSLYS